MQTKELIAWRNFDDGTVIREPLGQGPGYWVGAPGVFFDEQDHTFYLTYRIRRPRGIAPDRGGEARIARSDDGITFEDIWTTTKDAFSTASMERSALQKGKDGSWHYFTSYVDPNDGRWCLSSLKANRLEELNPRSVTRVFSAKDLSVEGVKDPWIMEVSGQYLMFLSVALPTDQTTEASHATLDIYNTGECRSASALAISGDLDHWQWRGLIMQPGKTGWDQYCRRLNSVIHLNDGYVGFYDGNASHHENYEEKTGVAESRDLNSWKSLSTTKPFLTSPHATGSLRYLNAIIVADEIYTYYEFARADGSHDLRVLKHPLD